MSNEVFLISDTHFGHSNLLAFKDGLGQPIRPYKTLEEMEEALISNWNSVVRPNDRVYHLGDVAMSKKGLLCLRRCNGNKVLIRGNHDTFKLKDYAEHFKDIRGACVLGGYVLTHIPIHRECSGKFKKNIHGHLHANKLNDSFYINVSVEQINFTPINFEELQVDDLLITT
jgi:calcineurin-like phosphoesterase family protein